MKRVLIIEAQMKQYRAPFYAQLYDSLRAEGIQLTVAYSDPPEAERGKRDNCDLPEGYGLKVKGYWLWPRRLFYQPLFRTATASDLVVADTGNRFLLNHVLLPLSGMGLLRIAFWGHAANRQTTLIPLSEWYRRRTLNWVTWWFAYTEGDAAYLRKHGIPTERITTVHNSVDTREIQEHLKILTFRERTGLRARLGIPAQAPVGVFCGTLTKLKKLPFLIESCRMIKTRVPMFHLIIIGTGPEQDTVQRLTEDLGWVHCLGARFGKEKAELLAISDALLLPGAMGLAVLDAFAAGLPALTIRLDIHGPEIEYLEDGVNGLMSEPTPSAFAETASSLLSQSDFLARLRAGARTSAKKYSIENMVENFLTGIRSCLRLSASCGRVHVSGTQKPEQAVSGSSNGHGFAITTSWDDGHPLDFRVAELLAKHGLQGTFYVPFENSRPTLSPTQIRDLSSSFEIGAHTVHHSVLTTVPDEQAHTEIVQSKARLEEVTGTPCRVFCFPRGGYANTHVDMLREAGFSGARTVELLSFDCPRSKRGIAIMPTTVQACPNPTFTYLRNGAKRFRSKALLRLVLYNHGTDWAATAISLLDRWRLIGGVFHLWGHSWEIEEYRQWDALDRVLAAMSEARRLAPCVTNSELCVNGL